MAQRIYNNKNLNNSFKNKYSTNLYHTRSDRYEVLFLNKEVLKKFIKINLEYEKKKLENKKNFLSTKIIKNIQSNIKLNSSNNNNEKIKIIEEILESYISNPNIIKQHINNKNKVNNNNKEKLMNQQKSSNIKVPENFYLKNIKFLERLSPLRIYSYYPRKTEINFSNLKFKIINQNNYFNIFKNWYPIVNSYYKISDDISKNIYDYYQEIFTKLSPTSLIKIKDIIENTENTKSKDGFKKKMNKILNIVTENTKNTKNEINKYNIDHFIILDIKKNRFGRIKKIKNNSLQGGAICADPTTCTVVLIIACITFVFLCICIVEGLIYFASKVIQFDFKPSFCESLMHSL